MKKVNDPIREQLRNECRKIQKDYLWLVSRTLTKAVYLDHPTPYAYEVRLIFAKFTSIPGELIYQWKAQLGCQSFTVDILYEHMTIVFYKLVNNDYMNTN